MERAYRILDRALTVVLLFLVVMMVLSITSEILLREAVQAALQRVFAEPPSWIAYVSAPLNVMSQTLLVWVGILGSALALRYRAHIGVDSLVRLYPPKLRLVMDRLATVLIALFSLAVLVYGGSMVCITALKSGSRVPGFERLNMAWFYAVLPITGVLNLAYCAFLFRRPKPAGSDDAAEDPDS